MRRQASLTYQPACKPGSVWRRAEPDAWRPFLWNAGYPALRATYPDGRTWTSILEHRRRSRDALVPRRPYSVLLPVGFAVPLALPQARCALTAPFHPYRSTPPGGRRPRAVCFLWHCP